MKRLLIAGLVVMAATAAVAQHSTTVTSDNVVGYLQLDLPKGYTIVRNDFISMEGDQSVQSVLGDQLPLYSRVYIWDPSAGAQGEYVPEIYETRSVGTPPNHETVTKWWPGTNLLDFGVGFWTGIPQDADEDFYTVSIKGEVTDAASLQVSVVEGFNLLGYTYPVDVLWTNTALAKSASEGDKLYLFRNEDFEPYEYAARSVGVPPNHSTVTNWGVTDLMIYMGEGFFYQRSDSAPINWTETKPYQFP